MREDKLTRQARLREGTTSVSSRDVNRTSDLKGVSTRPSLMPGLSRQSLGSAFALGVCGFAAGAAAGAAVMYLLDPDRGRRRRALARDRLARTSHELSDSLRATASDLGNRTRGLAHEVGRKVMPGDDVDDTKLKARVRSAIGHSIDHPHSVVVSCDGGRVTLAGPVLRSEKDELLSTVRKVPGVRTVRDLLEMHDSAEGVPALQALQEDPSSEEAGDAVH